MVLWRATHTSTIPEIISHPPPRTMFYPPPLEDACSRARAAYSRKGHIWKSHFSPQAWDADPTGEGVAKCWKSGGETRNHLLGCLWDLRGCWAQLEGEGKPHQNKEEKHLPPAVVLQCSLPTDPHASYKGEMSTGLAAASQSRAKEYVWRWGTIAKSPAQVQNPMNCHFPIGWCGGSVQTSSPLPVHWG